MTIKLESDQQEAADKFKVWLHDTDSLTAGLWASAGFGKSYAAKYLIDEIIMKSSYDVVVTSLTHSAVDVLEKFVGQPVVTLHSFMGWIPSVDKKTGEEYLSTPKMRGKKSNLAYGMLILIDEAGLAGHDEVELLLAEAKEVGARILFIGDNKQCFPVSKKPNQEQTIPAYDMTECYLHLTIPKRVDKGDMIYALSTQYRLAVDGGRMPHLKTLMNPDGSGKGVRVVDDIEEWCYKAFAVAKEKGYLDLVKVLAFRNVRCLNLNRKIRKKVMGLSDPTPIVGEQMVANTTIQNATRDMTLIKNNQYVRVTAVEKTEQFGLKGAFIDFEGIEETVFVPASPDQLATRLKKIAADAKTLRSQGKDEEAGKYWRAFFSLKEGCADIRYTYAMTVNKCQGVTLKHALIDLDDINQCRGREAKVRLAYTAVTRATDYVTIEGELDG